MPFGMLQVSPINGISKWDWCSGYHYSDSIAVGFSHLSLSGTGIGDLADVLFMPTNKEVDLSKEVTRGIQLTISCMPFLHALILENKVNF